jgi:hypothetical protein
VVAAVVVLKPGAALDIDSLLKHFAVARTPDIVPVSGR